VWLIRPQLVGELREVIAALDRGVPQVERVGEASIARDAAMLKARALKRIAELADQCSQSIGLGARGRGACACTHLHRFRSKLRFQLLLNGDPHRKRPAADERKARTPPVPART
jgi:hypothetical protein